MPDTCDNTNMRKTQKTQKTQQDPDSEPMTKFEKICRFCLSSVFLTLSLWIFLPVFWRYIHVGTFFSLGFFILFLLTSSRRIYRLVFETRKGLGTFMTLALHVTVLLVCVSLSLLIYGAARPLQSDTPVLIVLGCQVKGEAPSLMLQKRIQKAAEFALAHPETTIIASGGKGEGENIAEAECIRRELVKLGIDDSRILVENRSVDTRENLLFSADILKKENLGTHVIVVTNRFHQYRAHYFAKQVGLTTSPLSVSTTVFLAPGFWLREVLGLWRAWILGY